VLELSDGSKIELGEKTNITFSTLLEDPQTGARISRLELSRGKMRAFLSSGHQVSGSSFTAQTPNALVGMESSSELDLEARYDPTTNTTTVIAHKFNVVVTNLLTGVSMLIPQGHSAIIRDNFIQEIGRIVPPFVETPQPPIETIQSND
jgi:hypothetical protein